MNSLKSAHQEKPLALITGGTSGIGLASAFQLAPTHDLALVYAQNEIRATKALRAIEDKHPTTQVTLIQKPLFKFQDVQELMAQLKETFPKRAVSTLVHAAGRIRDGLYLSSDFDDHASIIHEHLLVGMALSHQCLKGMYRQRFGRIILLSSISANYAKRGQASYAAAKGGLESFAATLALEVAHRGITVNCIAPGLIDTPMTEALLETLKQKGKGLSDRVPTGRAGSPMEVAQLVEFLASEKGAYITGSSYTIDGGRSLGDVHS